MVLSEEYWNIELKMNGANTFDISIISNKV